MRNKQSEQIKQELGFHIETREGVDVLVFKNGGSRPATDAEVKLYSILATEKVRIGYMKSVPGEDDFSMFVNEYPDGGFEWKFLDFKPEDSENYRPIYISLEQKPKERA